jgi:hypothetical protein
MGYEVSFAGDSGTAIKAFSSEAAFAKAAAAK